MKPTITLKFAALVLFCASSLSSLSHAGDGEWIDLFDGKTKAGWIQMNGTVPYEVEDGAIVGSSFAGDSPMSFLCTEKQYGDFELEFDVKLFDRELNSGVQIRSLPRSMKEKGGKTIYGGISGPQVEIAAPKKPGDKTKSGFIYGQGWGGYITPKEDILYHDLFKLGEWNHYRVIAKGDTITTFINDTQVTVTTIPADRHATNATGHIGLQVHALKDTPKAYKVAWKNLRIKEL